jgi:outer membrane protein TolC
MFQAGRVGRGEELSALVNLGNDRINVLRRQAQLATDQAQLAIWLARPGTSDLAAVDPGVFQREPEPAPTLEAALADALRNRPLLVALQEQVRAAELGISIARAGYLPRITGDVNYSRRGPEAGPVFTEPRLQNTFTVGVGLQWNLFNGLGTGAQVSGAEAQLRRTQLTLTQTQRELEAEVRRTLVVLQSQLETARIARENREAAVQSLTLQEERFRAGAGSTLEVRDAQLRLTQAELSLLESRIDVEIARFTLTRAMGSLSPGESR